MKIYSYPHAGGSAASYTYFKNNFPLNIGEIVPIEIPGRGKRSKEQFSIDITDCISKSISQLPVHEEFILHGHCMGALLAFETVKYLTLNNKKLPKLLIISGRNAPKYQTDWGKKVANLEDKELYAELKTVGGIPKGLSFSMAQQFLEIIRNDQRIVHAYKPDDRKISVPILVLSGDNDFMTNESSLLEWKEYTTNTVNFGVMSGEHYFIYNQPFEFAEEISKLELV